MDKISPQSFRKINSEILVSNKELLNKSSALNKLVCACLNSSDETRASEYFSSNLENDNLLVW